MIYEENLLLFDELIKGLSILKNKINSLEWEFPLEFPVK